MGKDKPEIQLTRWLLVNGNVTGMAHMDDGDILISEYILKRPMNAREGDKIETVKTIYILVGKGVR